MSISKYRHEYKYQKLTCEFEQNIITSAKTNTHTYRYKFRCKCEYNGNLKILVAIAMIVIRYVNIQVRTNIIARIYMYSI